MPILKSLTKQEEMEIDFDPLAVKLPTIQSKLREVLPALVPTEDKVIEILEEKGAGLERTVTTLAEIMHTGGSEDSVRLKATELALRLHRALKDEDGKRQYNFTFLIKGDDVNIQSILQPERS